MPLFLDSMDPTTFLVTGIFVALAIIIQVVIIRWVFKIDEQVSNQKAMIWLLIKMCEKHGVDLKELEQIRTTFKIK